MRLKFLLPLGLLAATVIPACADSVSVNFTSSTSSDVTTSSVPGAAIFYDFDSVQNTSVGTFSGGLITSGSGLFTAPASGNYIVAWSQLNPQTPTVTLTLTNPLTYVGFAWGTPDPSNTVEIFGQNGLIETVIGSSLNLNGTGHTGFFDITANPGTTITKLVLSSDGCCFETDNYSYLPAAVPGPVVGGGLPGLLAGVGAMLAWYRKRRAVVI